MIENFNVKNPTKENIEYAFKNLIFYITASIQLDLYQEQQREFKKILDEVYNILAIYVNTDNILAIAEDKLQNIRYDLIDLDVETKALKSYFVEWSLLWLEAIISLRESLVKQGKN